MSHWQPTSGETTTGLPPEEQYRAGDLGDLLQELRVLLPGVQVLTGFLIVLPFYQGFTQIAPVEKGVYLVTFACSLLALVLFSAPAAQHRLEWPLRDRAQFKRYATHVIIVGLVPLSVALILTTQLVVAVVLGGLVGLLAAGAVAVLIGTSWWLFPLFWQRAARTGRT